MPPAWAVETRRALKSAQQGPTMSRPIRMTRDPRSASAAVISNMMATLNLKKERRVLSPTDTTIAAGPQRCSVVVWVSYAGTVGRFGTSVTLFMTHSASASDPSSFRSCIVDGKGNFTGGAPVDDKRVLGSIFGLDQKTGTHELVRDGGGSLYLFHRQVDQDAVLRRTEDKSPVGQDQPSLSLPLLQTATGIEEEREDFDGDGLVGLRGSPRSRPIVPSSHRTSLPHLLVVGSFCAVFFVAGRRGNVTQGVDS